MIFLRSLLFQIYLVLVTLTLGIAGLPVLFFNAQTRRNFCKFWSRLILFGLYWICGIREEISGLDYIPQGGAVIAANHQSMWETMKIYSILPKPVMVLKRELLRIPIFGLWLKASGCIALDRAASSKAMRQLINDAKKATADGGQIIIFPEGTRLKPGMHTTLKPGIAGIYTAANVPCLPIGHNSGSYWEYPGGRKLPGTIHMSIAPLIEAGHPRKTFMNELEQKLLSLRPDIPSTTQINPQ